jgi:[acyl-carrier-protein] S-malonyltransferase
LQFGSWNFEFKEGVMSKTAVLFPGQGAQVVGMGKQLCETLPAARRLFDEAAEILGYNLAEVCVRGPAERLNSTVISQPAIFVASLAALEDLKAKEPEAVQTCMATAGLSLGEYSALVFAGAMGFQDALRVVRRRGEAMQAAADATPSGMVSIVGMDQAQVEEICSQARHAGTMQIANLLCPGNIVVSGNLPACEEVERLVKEKGGRTVRLTVAGAFHTDLMKPADQALAEILRTVTIQVPRVPVWSNVDAQPHNSPEEIRELLVRQVLQPVLWEQTLRNLLAAGCERFFEIGPGRVLAGLLKRVQRKVDCRNVSA